MAAIGAIKVMAFVKFGLFLFLSDIIGVLDGTRSENENVDSVQAMYFEQACCTKNRHVRHHKGKITYYIGHLNSSGIVKCECAHARLLYNKKALKMMEDQESMTVLEHVYRRALKENTTLVAVLDEPVEKPTIIGVQIKVIFSKGDSLSPKSKGEALKKYDKLIEAAMGGINFFEEFNCDSYFEDFGMCVAPAFRGKKVAENIFESVAEMAKALKVRGEANMFLNPGLDKMALRVGFKVLRAVKYKDIKDENGEPVVNVGTEYVVCYGRTFY